MERASVVRPTEPWRWMRGLVWVLVLSAVVPVFAQTEATPVVIDEVVSQAMTRTVPVIGRLVSLQTGVVAARTAGPVAEMRVEVGEHVDAGDILAVLDQDRLSAYVEQRRRGLEEQAARRDTGLAREKLARQELSRLQRLRDSAAFAESIYDNRVQELSAARSALLEAEARIGSEEVGLELAQLDLRDSEIRAPFPGVVTVKHSSVGAWLRVGDPVITLLNDRDLEIEADVPAQYAVTLRPGQQLFYLLDNDERKQATVRAVVPDENPAARTRAVRFTAELSAAGGMLAVNQSVTVLVPVGVGETVVTIAKDAVLRRGGGAVVFVVADGIAKPRSLTLGDAIDDRFQVIDGLQPGERVVVRGNERLRPGQAVRAMEDDAIPAGS